MKEEKIDKVETKETPDVQKNLEEVKGTSESKETKMEKENKTGENDETIDVYVSADEVSNQDVLKGIEDLKSLVTKGIDEGIESKVDEKLEEFKKSLPNVDELKKEIQDYVKKNTAPYKYPRIVVFRDELPKTISGKIIRNKL